MSSTTRLAVVVVAVAAAAVVQADQIAVWLGNGTAANGLGISPTAITVPGDGSSVFWQTSTDFEYFVYMEDAPGRCVASATLNEGNPASAGGSVTKHVGRGTHWTAGVYYWYADVSGMAPGQACKMGNEGVITVLPPGATVSRAPSSTPSSPSSSSSSDQTQASASSTPSIGVIAGAGIGGLAVLGMMAAGISICMRRQRRRAEAKAAARAAAMDMANVHLTPGPKNGVTGLEVSIPYEPIPPGTVAELKASIPYEPLPPGSVAELKASIPFDPAAADVKPSPPRRAASLTVESTREVVAAAAAAARLSKIEEESPQPTGGGRGADVRMRMSADPSTTILGKVLPPSVVGGSGISPSLERRPPPTRSVGMASTSGDTVVMPEVARWSTADVARWLEDSLQLRPAVVNAFKGSNVDGARLMTLTDEDLSIQMGLSEDVKLMFRAALERLVRGSAGGGTLVAPPPYHSSIVAA
ncbi:hypothetical protein HK101_000992 [Irineochytrium annulatum]|nr:hypothetical protein HK101_000992 [Irineochytrium annulatum]